MSKLITEEKTQNIIKQIRSDFIAHANIDDIGFPAETLFAPETQKFVFATITINVLHDIFHERRYTHAPNVGDLQYLLLQAFCNHKYNDELDKHLVTRFFGTTSDVMGHLEDLAWNHYDLYYSGAPIPVLQYIGCKVEGDLWVSRAAELKIKHDN